MPACFGMAGVYVLAVPGGPGAISVGQSERKVYGNKEQGQEVSFELNPDGRTTDGEKRQAMSATRKRSPVIGRSYADVARKATRKVAVVSKSVQLMLLTL
jgi:hypothetical protein